MSGMFVLARLSVPGGWLSVTDSPYSLADGTYEALETRLERIEAKSPFYEGSWTVQATRSNDVIPFNIRVKYPSGLARVFDAVNTLKAALLQQTFVLDFRYDDYVVKHTCFATDFIIDTSKPLLFATQAVVKCQLPAIPN